jgi:integrase
LNFLIGFEKHTNRTIHLYDFNTNFKEELTIYAYKVRNLSNSTLHSYYKNIRMVTAYLKESGFKFNDIFLVNDIKEEPNNELITLSIEQVKQLKNYKPKNKAEELFHDLIVLQLETGQRISDIKRLNSSMIIEKNSKKYITFKQEKTGIEVILPCTDTIDIILKKYNGKIPKFDLKELNKRLKKISKSLEFNNEFTIKKRQGKEVTTKIMKLHEIISTHKLRSTVITLLDDNSTSISSIMNIAGHKELETTSKYLKQDKLTSAESFRTLLEETK